MATCLLVEDDELVGQLLEFLIKREGHEVLWVHDGREAMNVIQGDTSLNLAVLDVMVPHVNGMQLLTRLREYEPTRNLPVLMLTGRSGAEDIAQALDQGADDYLVKPFQPEEFSARLRRLMRGR